AVGGPRLRQVKPVEAGTVGRRGQLGDDLAAVLEGHERHGDPRTAHGALFYPTLHRAPSCARSAGCRFEGVACSARLCSSPPPRVRGPPRVSWRPGPLPTSPSAPCSWSPPSTRIWGRSTCLSRSASPPRRGSTRPTSSRICICSGPPSWATPPLPDRPTPRRCAKGL